MAAFRLAVLAYLSLVSRVQGTDDEDDNALLQVKATDHVERADPPAECLSFCSMNRTDSCGSVGAGALSCAGYYVQGANGRVKQCSWKNKKCKLVPGQELRVQCPEDFANACEAAKEKEEESAAEDMAVMCGNRPCYHIKVKGGVTPSDKDFLSVEAFTLPGLAPGVDLWYKDDGSGRQVWTITPVDERCQSWEDCKDKEMHIRLFGGIKGLLINRTYLSSNLRGTDINLWHEDDGSGRQRWKISSCSDRGCGADDKHIQVAGGIFHIGWGKTKSYLSAYEGANGVDLYEEDDKSNRQRWLVEPVSKTGGGKSDSGTQSLEYWMGRIAEAVYGFPVSPLGTGVEGWSIAKQLIDSDGLLGTDKLSIYQQGHKCVLAFSGSDDAMDWIEDFSFFPTQACGVDLHSGFHTEMVRLTSNARWHEFNSYLTSQECSGGRYVVGHSLGGAIAHTFVGCMEYEDNITPFKLDGLYTFGAPGVSMTPMTGPGGACIPGSRFYNEDLAGGDPVPWITSVIGLKHPKMDAVRLRDFMGKSKETTACDDPRSSEVPNGAFVPRIIKHLMPFYNDRVNLLLS